MLSIGSRRACGMSAAAGRALLAAMWRLGGRLGLTGGAGSTARRPCRKAVAAGLLWAHSAAIDTLLRMY